MPPRFRELHETFLFEVSFAKDESAFFRACGPIEADVSIQTYKEAGAVIPIKDPDGVEFSNVTLDRGTSSSTVFYDWLQEVLNSLNGLREGRPIPNYFKRTVMVYQLSRQRQRLRRWDLVNAFPVKFRGGTWDNSTDEINIESLTLAYDFFACTTVRRGEATSDDI